MIPNTSESYSGAVMVTARCTCGANLYRRKFNDRKDMLQCLNIYCPKHHQIQKYVRRGIVKL